jgi:AmmeMemoRadiSam system protein A
MSDTQGARPLSENQGLMLVELARGTIMAKLRGAALPDKDDALTVSLRDPIFQEKRGVFVTLHRNCRLRGCIGSMGGATTIVQGVKDNAINAAFNDFRFKPVTVAELDEIEVEVSILSAPRLLAYDSVVELVGKLRPGVDGVIIKKGGASATFLPQVWQQLPDVADFLSHLCRKAGLAAEAWRHGDLEVITYQVQCFAEEKSA